MSAAKNDIEQFVKQIKAHISIINAERRELAKLEDEMIDKCCPVKIDDVVTIPHSVWHSHPGRQIKVTEITIRGNYLDDSPESFVINGRLLRKDGSVSKFAAHYTIHLTK